MSNVTDSSQTSGGHTVEVDTAEFAAIRTALDRMAEEIDVLREQVAFRLAVEDVAYGTLTRRAPRRVSYLQPVSDDN